MQFLEKDLRGVQGKKPERLKTLWKKRDQNHLNDWTEEASTIL
jgi:hypothetical protein